MAGTGEVKASLASIGGRKAEPDSARNSDAILVLGMHRSGTSAVARVLGLMGVHIGSADDLLPADPQDNPTGYWERAELNLAHDEFLQASGHAWNRVAGFDVHDGPGEAKRNLSSQIRAAIAKLDVEGRPWLIKDPRLCLLLPQWQTLLPGATCVVVVRDPREIAASMQASPRGTFTSAFVLALWEKYLCTALRDLSGQRALFVSYPALLTDTPGQCARLLQSLRDMKVFGVHRADLDETAEFLDLNLHRSIARAHVNLSPAQQALFAWLDLQCQANGPVAIEGFPETLPPDPTLAEFQAAFDYHAELGRQRGIGYTPNRLESIHSMLPAHDEERTQWLQEIRAQRENAERIWQALELERQRAEQAGRELDLQQEAARSAHAESGVLRSQLAALAEEHVLTQNHVVNIEAERSYFSQQLAQVNVHVTSLHRGMAELKSSWSWKVSAPLRVVGKLVLPVTSYGTEQRLYRWYYAIPGISASRKRALIIWLHKHATWLTRNTLSYQIFEQSQASSTAPIASAVLIDGERRMDAQRAHAIVDRMKDPPRISIVMPVYNVERRWLMAAVDSVRRQFYPHWELCIADDASTSAGTREVLDELARCGDPRIKVQRLRKNAGIAHASNTALKMATGSYVGLLDNDDELTRDALLEVARALIDQPLDIVYSDEDKIDVDGSHVEAHFKPDFNPDYFLSINYVCHFTVLRRELLDRLGGFRTGFEGAQDYDLFLRATEHGERIAHIPKILYHWRKTASSTATTSSAKPKSWDAGQRALAESLRRREIDAVADLGPYPNTFRVRRTIAGQPLVSVLIPFRDQAQLLATCIDSILEKTEYVNYEIIGIDNGSTDKATHALMKKLTARDARVRFVRHDVPFNYSEINNFGVTQAKGEHLLLLNNDTEVINAEWLQAMLEHSQRPEVGVVGAKLLYPDQHIQHAGVIVGIGGVAGHAHLHQAGDRPGYFSRAQLPQNLSAVTFACAMTRRDVFEQLGGLNAADLTIAFNDIDYCLRAREADYLVVYTPFAQLYHHESRTRGYEDNPEKQARFSREIAYMQKRHRAILESGDPYYNPNLRLDLHDFSARPGYVDALPI